MLSEPYIAALADLFRLLGDQTRLRIVICCLDEPVSVGQIAERLGLSQSLVSHHLRLLRAAHLVRFERRGKQVLYEAADDHVRTVLHDMVDHTGEILGDAPVPAVTKPAVTKPAVTKPAAAKKAAAKKPPGRKRANARAA